MADLFEREQRVLNNALNQYNDLLNGGVCSIEEFGNLMKEYARLLKQVRRITKMSDKTTVDLNTSRQDLLDQIRYDPLTGIYNRGYMEENLKRIIQSFSGGEGVLSVMMLDVDFFKDYNDTYGHSQGDICLKAIAAILKGCIVRKDDFVARYGGEEFTIVLPNTDEEGAVLIAQRILERVRAKSIPHEKSKIAPYVTISIGLTTGKVSFAHTGDIYLQCADKALYMSKHGGRDRYTVVGLEMYGV